MLTVKKFTFNPFQENTYIVWDDITLEGAIIDPGCYDEKEEEELSLFIDKNKLNIKYLINTHCHIDHSLGNRYVLQKYHVPFYGPELDVPLLNNIVNQGNMFGLNVHESPKIDIYLSEELKLNLGKSIMSFIFTPGHTPGEYCLLFEEEKILLSGDVLFYQGIGRTDLWGGDYDTLIDSIKKKIFVLDDSIVVYPGQGDKTEIGYEKSNNPFF